MVAVVEVVVVVVVTFRSLISFCYISTTFELEIRFLDPKIPRVMYLNLNMDVINPNCDYDDIDVEIENPGLDVESLDIDSTSTVLAMTFLHKRVARVA